MQIANDLRALAALPEFEETETASLMIQAALLLDAQERDNAKLRELADRLAAELRLHHVSCEALHEHAKLS